MNAKKQRKLSASEWEQAAALFQQCQEMPDELRTAHLDAAATSPEIRAEVESLLAAAKASYAPIEIPLLPKLIGLDGEKTASGTSQVSQATSSRRAFQPTWAGKYLLVQKLGEGGMAEVFRAKILGPLGFQKRVAIKRVLSAYSDNTEFGKMFELEARLSSLLSHANIVQIYDFFNSDGSYHLAMEYIHGNNLAHAVRKAQQMGVAFPLECSLFVISEICKALEYAHTLQDEKEHQALHIVHRDISPKNIMVSYDGAIKLVDFGIAKARDRVTLTRSGQLRGTLNYMAPEVSLGQEADHCSDLFSVGVILFELLSGEALFEANGVMHALRMVQQYEVPEARINALDVDPRLKEILLRTLAKDPAQRYKFARELQLDLSPLLAVKRAMLPQESLSRLMKSVFAEEREREKAELEHIEAFLRDYQKDIQAKPVADPYPSIRPSGPRPDLRVVPDETVVAGASLDSDERRRSPAFWAGSALMIGALAFLGFGIHQSFSPESDLSPRSTAPAPKGVAPRSPSREPLGEPAKIRELQPSSATTAQGRAEGKCNAVIDSDPHGAKLSINGVYAGMTPATVALTCGEPMVLTLEHPGYDTTRETVRVKEDNSSLLLVLSR